VNRPAHHRREADDVHDGGDDRASDRNRPGRDARAKPRADGDRDDMVEPWKRGRTWEARRGVGDDEHEADRRADDRARPIRAGMFPRAVQVDGSLQWTGEGEMFLARRASALGRPTL